MRNKIFILIGLLLIIVAFCLTINNIKNNEKAEKESEKIVKEITEKISQKMTENNNEENTSKSTNIKIGDEEYIGLIKIEKIDLILPIIDNWDYNKLSKAPCRYSGSIDNKLIICAHNYPSQFGELKKLEEGDIITITDINGINHNYKVGKKENIYYKNIEEMKNTDWDLSLFTCTVGGKARLTIRCQKI